MFSYQPDIESLEDYEWRVSSQNVNQRNEFLFTLLQDFLPTTVSVAHQGVAVTQKYVVMIFTAVKAYPLQSFIILVLLVSLTFNFLMFWSFANSYHALVKEYNELLILKNAQKEYFDSQRSVGVLAMCALTSFFFGFISL